MPKIEFSKDWNNKLSGDYFTTIRIFDDGKFLYYLQCLRQGFVFDVAVNKSIVAKAKLVDISVSLLKNIDITLINTDSGLSEPDFYLLMEKMYQKKDMWAEDYTPMVVLCFKKWIENKKSG